MIVAMSPDGVIKHFDIIEHITPCLLAVGIDPSAYPLPLEQLEETLSHSIGFSPSTQPAHKESAMLRT